MLGPSALIETNRGDVLSGFHESARDFCREACLAFDREGVHLYGTDNANVVRVQYHLPTMSIEANGQGRYVPPTEKIEVCIDTKMVANCLGSVACGDLVGFSVDMENEPDRLTVRCQNPVSGKKSCYKVVIPEFPENRVDPTPMEEYGYNSEIVISSSLFHDMLRDLTKSDTHSVRVCCDGNRLVLLANGRHVRAAFEINAGSDQSHFRYSPKPSDRWPVCECFSIMYLQKVAKAKGVAPNIVMYLQPNFAIAFAYITDLGKLCFMISTRDDDEWLENPETRRMPPKSIDIQGIPPRRKSNGTKRKQCALQITSDGDALECADGDGGDVDSAEDAEGDDDDTPTGSHRKRRRKNDGDQ